MLLLVIVPSLAWLLDDASNSTDVNASESEAFPVDFSESESEQETTEPEATTEDANETSEITFEPTTEEWNETSEVAFETTTEEILETSEPESETATEEVLETSEPEIESPSSEVEPTQEPTSEPTSEPVEPTQEPTSEPVEPTPEPPTKTPDYRSDEVCMCAGDECRRCEAQQLGFSQMNNFLENARSDDLEIEIRGSSAQDRVPVSAKSIAANTRLEELKFEGKGTGYVQLEFDGNPKVSK